MVKNLPANAGDLGLIPGLGISLEGQYDSPLQYACQENPMDREAWQATVHRTTQSWSQLKQLNTQALTFIVQ